MAITALLYITCTGDEETIDGGGNTPTENIKVEVTTIEATDVMITSAQLNAIFSINDVENIEGKAFFFYDTNNDKAENIMRNGKMVQAGIISENDTVFNTIIDNLTPLTKYYYVASVIFDDKYYYGLVKSFTTQDNRENGNEFVDLGLSVNWATCNLGANIADEYGDYYAWGYTDIDNDISWSNYRFCGGTEFTLKKYNTVSYHGTVDNLYTLKLEDDVVNKKWGGKWRLPTDDEYQELLSNCTWEWTTINGINGYKVISKIPGFTDKYIFFPVTGWDGNMDNIAGYWSSTLYKEWPLGARCLFFTPDKYTTSWNYRCNVMTIRPVCRSMRYVEAEAITFEKDMIELNTEQQLLVPFSISPSHVSDKSLIWTSDNDSVAVVNYNGLVIPMGVGTATITASKGNLKATCLVKVSEYKPVKEAIDLGLSVKWASCNIGAYKPEDMGGYYAWGETENKRDYDDLNYKYIKDGSVTKYNYDSWYNIVDNKYTLEPDDDVAHVKWGDGWRIPTIAEFEELSENCTWTWTIVNGIEGYIITSKKEGYSDNSIFLPAAGGRQAADFINTVGYSGCYWSSSLNHNGSTCAYLLSFNLVNSRLYRELWANGVGRYRGHSIRPVCP